MYTAELEKDKREKEEWKRKAERLEDQASALQVHQPVGDSTRTPGPDVLTGGPFSAR